MANASVFSSNDPALNPMWIVDPNLAGCPVCDKEPTRVSGAVVGLANFGAVGKAFGGVAFIGEEGGSVTDLANFLAVVGLNNVGIAGGGGTGFGKSSKNLGGGGAVIAFGGLSKRGGASGRTFPSLRPVAGRAA